MNQRNYVPWIGALALLAAAPAPAASFYARHVFFENSLPARSWYYSEAMLVPPSELDLADGRLPIDTQHFFSPPNALRLHWRSSPGGEWRMTLSAEPYYGKLREFDGDTISFRCMSDTGLSPDDAPRIYLLDSNYEGSDTVPLLNTCGALPAGKWIKISIPFGSFKAMYGSTEDRSFNSRKLASICLMQGLDDGKEHILHIDDIQVFNGTNSTTHSLPATPAGLVAKGYERHCDLAWSANRAENILNYKLYRSWDGTNFAPLSVQRSDFCRAIDFIGEAGRTAFYRISAVDADGNESALSASVSAKTRTMSDDELLDMVQEGSFRYYWDAAHPNAGMAIEIRPGDEDLVAVGASGFGIIALVVGAERQFVPRAECAERLVKIVRFLKSADRFHGAWPHFLDGRTGKVLAYFGKYDDGGDLVETAFMTQGLLVARQYFNRDNRIEREIRDTITELWRGIEWDWYRKDADSDFLYWHWSPDHQWHIAHPLIGWNETMIAYLLAIASPTHPVPASLYYSGWAGQSDFAAGYRRTWSGTMVGDHYTNGNSYYGFKLDIGEGNGADLFFTQFSFMGFDPRGKRDRFANYFLNNQNIALINQAYCAENPRRRAGYGADCWGLSAGINSGGGRPAPRDDNGTICISAALGAFPYTPRESLAALKHFYRDLGSKTWGIYGFYDGFNETQDWSEPVWMGLNQGIIAGMIENQRTGLIWRNFMNNPEIAPALKAIGFVPDPPMSPAIGSTVTNLNAQ